MPHRSLVRLAALVIAGGFLVLWTADWLTLDWLKTHRDDLVAYCQRNMALMLLAYCLSFVAWATLCLPGAGMFALAGGMLFGSVLGTIFAALSAVTGATLAFLLARYLLHDWAHARFAAAFRIIDRGVMRDGALYVFMLRLIIIVPYFVVNPVLGLTDMRLKTFVWASGLGLVANSFMWVNAGTMLGGIERLDDVLSGPVVASFAVIGILPLALKWLFFKTK